MTDPFADVMGVKRGVERPTLPLRERVRGLVVSYVDFDNVRRQVSILNSVEGEEVIHLRARLRPMSKEGAVALGQNYLDTGKLDGLRRTEQGE